MLRNIFIGVLIYHTILTILHRTTKKKSCLFVNTIRFPFLYLISVCDFLAAALVILITKALVIKITKAADVWGREGWWWPLKSHSRFSYSDRLKKNITHISLSTFAKIFVQTFLLKPWYIGKADSSPSPFPLPPSPTFSKALLYWRLNIPESIWKWLSVSAFMKY